MSRWLLAVLLFGCSSPRPEPAGLASGSAPPAPPVVIDATVVVAIDADPHAGYPERVAKPESKCVLRGAWKDQPKTLAFTDGGKPFGEVFHITEASAVFGAGVFAEFTTATVKLAGFVDKSKIQVHAAAPFLVADFAAPGPKLAMKYISAEADQMTFELPLPPYAKTKAPLRTTRACGILAIDDKTEFFPRDAIDVDAQSQALLVTNKAIALAVEPGKPPVVTLTYRSSPPVDVLETSGKLSRVVVGIGSLNPAESVVFVGWVPSSAILPRSSGFGGSWASGGGGGARRGPPRKNTKFVSCPSETPLAVELAGEQRTVGAVLPNVVLEVLAEADWVEVRFAKPSVELAEGARWLVKQAALAGCAAVAAP
jgi:hypothetical protein